MCKWFPSLKDLCSDSVLLKFFGVFASIALRFYGEHQKTIQDVSKLLLYFLCTNMYKFKTHGCKNFK